MARGGGGDGRHRRTGGRLSLGLGSVLRVIVPLADLLLIALGLFLLFGRNPFARLPQVSPAALGRGGPVAGSFMYGLLFAPIALPCSGPFLIGIFVASLTVGDALRQLAFFAAFGIGFGLPLLALGLVGELRARERPSRWFDGAAAATGDGGHPGGHRRLGPVDQPAPGHRLEPWLMRPPYSWWTMIRTSATCCACTWSASAAA